MLVKLESLGYCMVKNCDDMLSRFHLIPERNGQIVMLTRDKMTESRCSVMRIL